MDENNLPEDLEKQKERDHAIYFVEAGDPGFSPERNKAVVAESIRRAKAMKLKRDREYRDQIGERVDAVVTYLRSRMAEGTSPLEHYFSKKELAHLRGQQILRTIRTKIAGKMRTVYVPE